VAGTEPLEVQASVSWTDRGVDEELTGILRFPDGVVAHFDCALTLERRETVEVSGSEGTLVVPSAFLPGTSDVALQELRGRKGETTHAVSGADEYRLMVEHFAEAVQTGSPFRYEAEEAARNMAAIGALYRSARRGGAPVPVEPADLSRSALS
jgi:predicted dehydrogenase